MSRALFIDESGQDQRNSPYEVLAGIAIEDRNIWPLIRQLSDMQQHIFGMRLFEAYGKEAKAQKLLKRKTFEHAAQMPPLALPQRSELARQILENGQDVTRERLTALAQAKLDYCQKALILCKSYNAKAFASIVPRNAPRPDAGHLRKDYSYLFERFYYHLNGHVDPTMGYLVFDELDKSQSHILLNQINAYFIRTAKGRTRSRQIIPEPFFVHSDLTTMIQIADLVAYIISWGMRLKGMTEPARNELLPFSDAVKDLRFKQETASGIMNYGFKVINDLNPVNV